MQELERFRRRCCAFFQVLLCKLSCDFWKYRRSLDLDRVERRWIKPQRLQHGRRHLDGLRLSRDSLWRKTGIGDALQLVRRCPKFDAW